VRAQHGIAPDQRVIGFFGFVTSAKRGEVVLEAFRRARSRDPRLVLLIVGEAAPNIDAFALRGDGVIVTGYVADEEFDAYYAAADRLVNLRYPSAGESSGTLIRALAAGKPVAVSEYAQFAELPESCAVRIPFGEREANLLADFFLRELDERAIAKAQRAWLDANARMDLTVDGYLRAIEEALGTTGAAGPLAVARHGSIPIFPSLQLVKAFAAEGSCEIEIRNTGDAALRGRTYSEPAYRLIAKVVADGKVVQDCWLELPGDLEPGASATLGFPLLAGHPRFTLQLFHALQQLPMLEPEAWATAEVGGV
ncbi:MAG: glycosyltransferase family 4 protein, partial [Thermoanaerobaculia bacterium]